VPTLDDIAHAQTRLTPSQVSWMRALMSDWQFVADLAFSDVVLWLLDGEEKGMWAAGQARPTTGPTTLVDDIVGTFVPQATLPAEERLTSGDVVNVRSVELRLEGVLVAVLALRSHADWQRLASRLELTYRQTADELLDMIGQGDFPVAGPVHDNASAIRVGDGFLRTDEYGVVTFASPNALSAYRRLGLIGDLEGADLVEITTGLVGHRPTDTSAATMLSSLDEQTEVENKWAVLQLRSIALRSDAQLRGHVVLLRDVTDLRERERELISKDATIREIHHRVKNNLQTVAALLRLQSRRLGNEEAREALREAEQRVGSIALVHETLSQSFDDQVDFDDVADTLLRTIPEMGAANIVRAERIGSFKLIPGEVATSLAMILTELVQNAVEHAFDGPGGRITVAVNRIRGRLRVRVSDNGKGLPADFDSGRSLGLSIVSTLVQSELGGELEFVSNLGAPGAIIDIAIDI
jgi:two-component system, sensor histidine kinase PdtaS